MRLATLLLTGALAFASDRPAIVDAAQNNDWAAVRAQLSAKANVNAADADGSTALHWAAYHDSLDATQALLKAGAKVNAVTDLGVTPLWLASQNGGSAVVGALLGAGADPNIALLAGETPLMVAARGGYADVVKQLLAKGAKTDARGTRGQTALMWAASQKHPAAVEALIKGGADIHARSDSWKQMMGIPPHGFLAYNAWIPHGNMTALLFAARSGDVDSAKILVEHGAKVDDKDAWGVSAVNLASHSGFTEFVEFLLSKGADPNIADPGFTPLLNAVMRRDERMVKALLDHGADPNFRVKTWTPSRRSSEDWNYDQATIGASPLWIAAHHASPSIVKLLLDKGADVNFVHEVGYVAEVGFGQAWREERNTVLHAAVNMGRVSGPWVAPKASEKEALTLATVKLLVEKGVDVNAPNKEGKTALDGANTLRYKSVVEYLTEHGAKATAPPPSPAKRGPVSR